MSKNNILGVEVYKSSTCPNDSFYLVDNQQLEEIKKFDRAFDRLKKMDQGLNGLPDNIVPLKAQRREVHFE